MSWEEDRIETHPCPCGKGNYEIAYLSDDWGRHGERWVMQCPECAASYTLRANYRTRKGITETFYEWIRSLPERGEKKVYHIHMTDDQILNLSFRGTTIKEMANKVFGGFIGESINGLDMAEMSSNGEYNARVGRLKDVFVRNVGGSESNYSATARANAIREAQWAREISSQKNSNRDIDNFYNMLANNNQEKVGNN